VTLLLAEGVNFNTDTGRVLFDDSRLLGRDDASLGEHFMIFKRIVLPTGHGGQVDSPNNAALRSRRRVRDYRHGATLGACTVTFLCHIMWSGSEVFPALYPVVTKGSLPWE